MSLNDVYSSMSGLDHQAIIRNAESMKVFAGDDETFNLGEWREWRNACIWDGYISPEEFKAKKAAK